MSAANSQPPGNSPFTYQRRPTRLVMVGDVGIGGASPIRVQSMTTTRGLDTEGTVAQTLRLVEAGCEIVRVTAPGVEDAANLREVRARLRALGVSVPLIADIHFNPQAALEAAKWVEKVRINPGNYADSRSNKRDYADAEYAAEIERIEGRLLPLIRVCREYGVATRVGVNHGSLSGRITSRFGDTPLGMVESALEFVRICERHGYRDLVLSMKASNPKVMIQAYRLLAARMDAEGMDYPFHLGVTEAGSGVEARVKSAAGIGALLDDGIGDTIRVSLAEAPEAEIPVAIAIASLYAGPAAEARLAPLRERPPSAPAEERDPCRYARRRSRRLQVGGIALGDSLPPAVIAEIAPGSTSAVLDRLFTTGGSTRAWPDVLAVSAGADLTETAARAAHLRRQLAERGLAAGVLVKARREAELAATTAGEALWLEVGEGAEPDPSTTFPASRWGVAGATAGQVDRALALLDTARAAGHDNVLLGLRSADPSRAVRATRLLAARLAGAGDDAALAVALDCAADPAVELPEGGALPIGAPIAIGSLFADGLGDAVCVRTLADRPDEGHTHLAGLQPTPPAPGLQSRDRIDNQTASGLSSVPASDVRLALDCLQAVGARSFKAEVIACPGCGRTLFDLAATTERVKARVGHLVGVKVAVMGCVVNGPGELADADFGYMGGAPGRVSLYVGHECVERSIPAEEAETRLVELIRSRGRWVEPRG